jgi:hypothetical protein
MEESNLILMICNHSVKAIYNIILTLLLYLSSKVVLISQKLIYETNNLVAVYFIGATATVRYEILNFIKALIPNLKI